MQKGTHSNRWWDLPAGLLLIAALITAASRLVATRWTGNLAITQTLVALAAIAGLALGVSRFSPRLVAFFAIAYGLFAVPWQLGMTMEGGRPWLERLAVLGNRIELVVYQLYHRDVVQDSILFLILMYILFWYLGVHAGYILTRYGNAWWATLPAGIATFIIHSFDATVPQRAWYLVVYIFFSLILISRMAFLLQQTRWQHSRTALPPHLGLDFIRFTLIAASLLVLFAWTIPAVAQNIPAATRVAQPIRQTWNELRDRVDNAFASLRSTVGIVGDYYGVGAILGRGNTLTDTQLFNVTTPPGLPNDVRLYWRARVYDTYESGQWLSTSTDTRAYDPEKEDLNLGSQKGRWVGDFEILPIGNFATLYTPPQPIWLSRPAQVEFYKYPDGTTDYSTFRATPTLKAGQSYQVQASLGNATVAQLREAGSEYPEWITERYLQLPETITPTSRIKDLAFAITEGLETPYDKVVAITNYLRNNITYQETLPSLPSNQEPIDWFLFDYQKGFCNYYSTAEVVMLRSIGIPARWALGYAQGETLPNNSKLIRQRDAHSWPEVYFPGIGWVEFEPTAAQPNISRVFGQSGTDENSLTPNENALAEEEKALREMQEELRRAREARLIAQAQDEAQNDWLKYLFWGIPILLAGSLVYLIWRRRDRIDTNNIPIYIESTLLRYGIRPPGFITNWSRRVSLPPMAKAYQEINNALNRLDKPPAVHTTPTERSTSLTQAIPSTKPHADQLVREYLRATYSQQTGDIVLARYASTEIRRISYRLYIRTFTRRLFSRLQRKPPTRV